MTDPDHRVHGVAGDHLAPDWPPLTRTEVDTVVSRIPGLGEVRSVAWHSPRPLSAACLVETTAATVFVKRHHVSVRNADMLLEEHRFIAWLQEGGIPIPRVLAEGKGGTVSAIGDWVYEVHERAAGIDVYREAFSWAPLPNAEHAFTAGRMLAMLHEASAGYAAPQRSTDILVARAEIVSAPDPVAAIEAQLDRRPALARYLGERPWRDEIAAALAPWHATAQPIIATQPMLWTHGDWHVSNLCWSSTAQDASITAVLDVGLSAATFALFDLATAIERNAIAWLEVARGDIAHPDIALALIAGYRSVRALSATELATLADLLPLVHVDFALSEVDYFEGITRQRAHADVAYDTFLVGHAAWFGTPPGRRLLDVIRGAT